MLLFPSFSLLSQQLQVVHDTWREDGEENKKRRNRFYDSYQEATDSHLMPVYSKQQSSTHLMALTIVSMNDMKAKVSNPDESEGSSRQAIVASEPLESTLGKKTTRGSIAEKELGFIFHIFSIFCMG